MTLEKSYYFNSWYWVIVAVLVILALLTLIEKILIREFPELDGNFFKDRWLFIYVKSCCIYIFMSMVLFGKFFFLTFIVSIYFVIFSVLSPAFIISIIFTIKDYLTIKSNFTYFYRPNYFKKHHLYWKEYFSKLYDNFDYIYIFWLVNTVIFIFFFILVYVLNVVYFGLFYFIILLSLLCNTVWIYCISVS